MGQPHGPYFVRVLGSRLEQEVHMRKPIGMYRHLSTSCSQEPFGIVMQVLRNRRTSGGNQGLKPKGMYRLLTLYCSQESFGIVKQVFGRRRTWAGHTGLIF